jgi:hypothetical protein
MCLGNLIINLLLISEVSGVTLENDSLNVKMLGEVHPFVEQCYDVALSENFAYIASGMASGLRVLDLSDPSTPFEVGYSINCDPCSEVPIWMTDRVRVKGDYAYVLYFDGTFSALNYRLYVYDISNPKNPEQMGYINLPDNCTSQFVEGDYVYITAFGFDFSGVKIIDVSNPMQPIEVGSFETPRMPQEVYVIEDIAYVADNNSLQIYDVTDPISPKRLGSYSPEGEISLFHYVAVQGNYVYIIDSTFGIRILDASDFSNIKEVGGVPHGQTDATFSRIEISDERAYYLLHGDNMEKKLIILDISDPTSPVEIGSHNMPGYWWFYGFDYYEGYACVAAGDKGLRVLDVSNPDSIMDVGFYEPCGLAFGLDVSNDYAFISLSSDSNNLLVYNVSDPSSPVLVNSLSFEGRPFWISVCENYLYVPGVEIDSVSGVSVLDISNPTEPIDIAFWPCPGGFGVPLSVERYESYAFVALAYGGVQIYDVTEVDKPVALGSWTLWDPISNPAFGVRNVKVSWPYILVPDEAYGLYVLDASDPMNIIEVASYSTPGEAWWGDISPDKNYLYLSDFTGGLIIFDVSNPLVPVGIGLYKENLEYLNHVLVVGDSVYISDGQGIGLRVLDVSDPSEPIEIAKHKTPGIYTLEVALENDLVYVLDKTHFGIFEIYKGIPVIVDYRIHSVYPNPFNSMVEITFDLPEACNAILQVYNINGQKIQTLLNTPYTAGRHTHTFQENNLNSGVYILKLDANGHTHSQKLILVK